MMEVDDGNSRLGLYDILDSTLRQFKALKVQETSTCIDLDNNSAFVTHRNNIALCQTSSASNTETGAKQNGTKKASGVQLVLPGTGRMNFVKKFNDASELFRVLGKGGSSSSRDGASGNEDLSIEQLSLENKKRPAGTTNGSADSNKKPPNNNVVKGAPSAKAAVTGTGTTAKPSANAMGSAAAKARMAALGEDWPEEEELPGFTPASSALASGGGASKDAMKMAHNSMQRQKKVIIAKKKT